MRLSAIRLIAGTILFLLVLAPAGAKKNKGKRGWDPIPPEELALKEHPAEKGAGAMVLFQEDLVDQTTGMWSVFRRIKIFNDSGREHATLQIPYFKKFFKIRNLEARRVGPNGKITPFEGEVFEKEIIKARGFKVRAKVLTIPDVQPGSIIEYRYTYDTLAGLMPYSWDVQDDLYVRKAKLTFLKDKTSFLTPVGVQCYALGLNHQNLKTSFFLGGFIWEALEIPSFFPEPNMPPETSLKTRVECYYVPTMHSDRETYWKEIGENAIGADPTLKQGSKKARRLAQSLVSPEDSPEQKARKIYDYLATHIKNLRYVEMESGTKGKDGTKYKENKTWDDVVKRGYGSGWDINGLYVAMLNAVGVEACLTRSSSRDRRFFNPNILSVDQLNTFNVAARIGDAWRFFDPATRYCPFGRILWQETGVQTLLLRGEESQLIQSTVEKAEDNVVHRRIRLRLQAEGSVEADVEARLKGQRAISARNRYAGMDDQERQESVQEALQETLAEATVSDLTFSNLESHKGELEYRYSMELPGYVTATGKRLLVAPALLHQASRARFFSTDRKYSVYFSYPYLDREEIEIEIPEGYQLEGQPKPKSYETPLGRFLWKLEEKDGRTVLTRELQLDAILISVEAYPLVKAFFDAIHAADKTQIVLRKQ